MSDVEKKIFFVAPSLDGGGAERVASALARYFDSRGYKFTFLITNRLVVSYDLPETVEIRYIGGMSLPSKMRYLRKTMREHPAARFVSFLENQNLMTIVASLGLKNRVFVSTRNLPDEDFRGNRMLQHVRDVVYGFASGIAFQTQAQRECFPDKVQNLGVVIPNPLSEDLPQPWDGERRKVITTSGRLTPQKNHAMTLRVFAAFLRNHSDFRLEIYGKGPLEGELFEQCEALGIVDAVDFMGFDPNAVNKIRSSSVFVMSSFFEGQPNALMEAIAMGVPSVCTRCRGGGAESVIKDGVNGFLVDIDDDRGMLNKICELVKSSHLSQSISGEGSKLKNSASLTEVGSRWVELLFPDEEIIRGVTR